MLADERFAEEDCHVVESALRQERLWISKATQRVRGILRFSVRESKPGFLEMPELQEVAGKNLTRRKYGNWMRNEATDAQHEQAGIAWARFMADVFPDSFDPGELIRLDDYREVKPGVWIPFQESRVVTYQSDKNPKKREYTKTEIVVESVALNHDLKSEIDSRLPRDGDQIHDQSHFDTQITYKLGELDEDEIRERAAKQREKLEQGQAIVDELAAEFDPLLGKPAPGFNDGRWLGESPELEGKRYLIHFWAAWCGPCKNDMPRLKELSEEIQVVGVHPPGTDIEEIETSIARQELNYPTFAVAKKVDDLVSGYPAKMFPYTVLVSEDGNVISHGSLQTVFLK